MRSLRARVAVAAVVATALAFVLSIVVVVGTFAFEFHQQGGPWDRQAGEAPAREIPGAAPADDRPPWWQQSGTAGPPDFIRGLAGRLVLVNLGVLGLVGATGLLLGGLALRPLVRLQTAAERVASTRDLATRLPHGNGPEEVDALAGSLNAMLERLQRSTAQTEAALEASRRFAADAGHELRTPLTSMRANLDVLARSSNLSAGEQRIMTDVAREQHRLLALLDGLQRLARGDAADAVPRERLDLADIVDAAVTNAASRHPSATMTFQGPEEAPIQGWSDGLRLLVDNLLDNAVRHTGPQVHVVVTLAIAGRVARLVVDDDGPGIPVDERQQAFQRFARGRAARGQGSGLGLALVAQQAAVHGGRAVIDTSPQGGTRVVVELALPGHAAGDGQGTNK
jgi:two-component system sensor histidine kinase PrrB